MEMLGLPSHECGGIGDELTASEEALRFGWASWAIHGLFKKPNGLWRRVLALAIPVRNEEAGGSNPLSSTRF